MPTARARHHRRCTYEHGSLRVQGWLYSVLWPLREVVAAAVAHLERGDATWRHGSAHLEWLRDPRHHLGAAGRVNLDDLVAVHGGELGPGLARYTVALNGLVAAAGEAQAVFERAIAETVRERRLRDPGGDAIGAAAAALVNATLDDDRGSDAALLAAMRDESARLVAVRPARLDDAYRATTAAATSLLAEIDDVRRELCDACDLPPAPFTLHVHTSRGRH